MEARPVRMELSASMKSWENAGIAELASGTGDSKWALHWLSHCHKFERGIQPPQHELCYWSREERVAYSSEWSFPATLTKAWKAIRCVRYRVRQSPIAVDGVRWTHGHEQTGQPPPWPRLSRAGTKYAGEQLCLAWMGGIGPWDCMKQSGAKLDVRACTRCVCNEVHGC
jgi:hypothetical protein